MRAVQWGFPAEVGIKSDTQMEERKFEEEVEEGVGWAIASSGSLRAGLRLRRRLGGPSILPLLTP